MVQRSVLKWVWCTSENGRPTVNDRFYIALFSTLLHFSTINIVLFSTLQQSHSTFVTCDSKWVTVAFTAPFEYPPKWCTTVLFGGYMVTILGKQAWNITGCECWLTLATPMLRVTKDLSFVVLYLHSVKKAQGK